jgi:hypothetical protein
MKYKFLKSEDYFYPGLPKKEFEVIVCDNKNKINDMINYFKKYMNINYKEKLVGIDFEFNNINKKREIALCQINFDSKESINFIYLFYPPDLSNEQLETFRDLLNSKDIRFILHGGESLDLPYIFSNILTKNRFPFLSNLIDTRYLCDYYHNENNIEGKCKINYLNKEMKVLTKNQFDFLEKEEEKMGPIYKIIVDVNKLNDLLILYTLTDVLYLPELVRKFPNNDIYNFIVPETLAYCFSAKDYLSINDDSFSNYINSFNNSFLRYNNERLMLNDLYYTIINIIDDKIVNNLRNINYFKKQLDILLKYVIYRKIIQNFTVLQKNDIYVNELSFAVTKFNPKFDYFYLIIESFEKQLKKLLTE